MFNNTSGPWEVTPMSYGYRVTHANRCFQQTTITTICRCDDEANARLISTSPDMYEILLEGIDLLPNGSPEHVQQWLDAARAIITKAVQS